MKFKVFASLLCGAILLGSAFCLAAVDGGKISLGRVYPGMSQTELLNAFGQPQSRYGDDWNYQSFTVEVEHGIVERVSTYSDTITTPDGVRVGQAVDILNSTFGRADELDYDDGATEYEYYSIDHTKKIEFKVLNGVITKITCKIND